MTSAGRRSAVHCTRAKCRSTERARARASAVLPTPGASSTSRWPSATSATMTWERVSSSTSTARETFAASRRARATAASHSSGATLDVLSRGSTTGLAPAAHTHHLVQYGAGDARLRAAWDRGLGPVGGDEGHLVVRRVEGDALGAHVVEDDEVESLAAELAAGDLEPPLAGLGGEADQRLPRPTGGAERGELVLGRLELEGRDPLVLLDLPG